MRSIGAHVILPCLAALLLAGCSHKEPARKAVAPKPLQPVGTLSAADQKALQQLAREVFTTFQRGQRSRFEALTVASLPAAQVQTALRTVRLHEARQFITRLETIPSAQRTAMQLQTLRLSKTFVADPKAAFAKEWPAMQKVVSELGVIQLQFFENLTATNAPLDWARAGEPSVVVSPNPQSDSILPEARVDLMFSAGGKSYRLQLSNCAKLPGQGWRVAEELRFMDLTAEAKAEKDWGTDLAAALKRAKAEHKRVLLAFTGSDWDPPCIALHDHVLTQPAFRDWAGETLVLVRADFPRHTSPPKAQADANWALVRAYAVQGFPTLLLLDAAGQELHRVEGYNHETAVVWVATLQQQLKPDDE